MNQEQYDNDMNKITRVFSELYSEIGILKADIHRLKGELYELKQFHPTKKESLESPLNAIKCKECEGYQSPYRNSCDCGYDNRDEKGMIR